MRPEFRRITDLFLEGQEIVLTDDPPVLIWIAKLNPFERQEANNDGRVARSRMILALQQEDGAERTLFRSSIYKLPDDKIIDAIVSSHYGEDLGAAVDDVRSQEHWQEHLLTLERGSSQLGDRPADDPEVLALSELSERYFKDVNAEADRRADDRRSDLTGKPRDELEDLYEDRWIDSRGMQMFNEAHRLTEVYYALRECQATKGENGRWLHEECHHDRKWLDDRDDVTELPDGLFTLVREAIDKLTMSPAEAKNSDRPGSSSASSPTQSEAAVSTVSTQEGTPSESAGTSTPPSATP